MSESKEGNFFFFEEGKEKEREEKRREEKRREEKKDVWFVGRVRGQSCVFWSEKNLANPPFSSSLGLSLVGDFSRHGGTTTTT